MSGNGSMSGSRREITLTCYDHFIYAQNSRTYRHFPGRGKSTKDILSALCSDAGIPLSYDFGSAVHDKTVYRRNAVADQIMDALDTAKKRLGKTPVTFFDKGTLYVKNEGYNKDIYVFKAAGVRMSTSERMSMDGLDPGGHLRRGGPGGPAAGGRRGAGEDRVRRPSGRGAPVQQLHPGHGQGGGGQHPRRGRQP